MKLLTTLFVLILPLFTQAQDLGFNEYRRFLMSGNQAGKKFAVQTTCTNAAGETTRVGEAGYDLCLNSAHQKSAKRKPSSEKSESLGTSANETNATNANNAAIGTTIHIGE